MFGDRRSWLETRTLTREFRCPWSGNDVTVRYLTCDGRHPIGLISCSDPTCTMPCLDDRPDRRVEEAPWAESPAL
jgi:hypothetical protein